MSESGRGGGIAGADGGAGVVVGGIDIICLPLAIAVAGLEFSGPGRHVASGRLGGCQGFDDSGRRIESAIEIRQE